MGTCCTVNNQNIINPINLSMNSGIEYFPKSRLNQQEYIENEQFMAYQKERWTHLRNHQKLGNSVVKNFGKIVNRNTNFIKKNREKVLTHQYHSSVIGSDTNNDRKTGLEELQDSNRYTNNRISKKTESIKIPPIEERVDEYSNKRTSFITGTALATRNSVVDISALQYELTDHQLKQRLNMHKDPNTSKTKVQGKRRHKHKTVESHIIDFPDFSSKKIQRSYSDVNQKKIIDKNRIGNHFYPGNSLLV